MSFFSRALQVFVPCFLLIFSVIPAASAYYLPNSYQDGGFYPSYWSRYSGQQVNTSGSGITQPVSTPAAQQAITPAATSPTTAPQTATAPVQPNSYQSGTAFQSYWDKYYNRSGSITLGPTNQGTQSTQPVNPQPSTQPAAEPVPQPTSQPATEPTQQTVSGLTTEENLLFNLTNQERVKAGLPAYKLDMRLVNLARQKSQDMYQNNYFSHTSPTYGSAYDMEKRAGISARVMGAENIARAATTQRAHDLLMGSSGHKANILNSLHDTIGIGIVKTQNGVYVTQLFTGK